jgi:Domain of unknown function (DUF4160)
MPEIVRLSNSRICIFPDDHTPPHFHLVGPVWKISIEIATLELLRGKAPRADLREAIQWARVPENLVTLVNAWRRLNERD